VLLSKLLSIVIHDNSHAVHIKTIGLGHHALSESVSNVVGTKEGGYDDKDMKGDNGKDDGVPPREDVALESHIGKLATGESTARETCRSDSGFDERAKVAATLELILNPKPTL
jgi:hypothetical protein